MTRRNIVGLDMAEYWSSFPDSAAKQIDRHLSDQLADGPCIFHYYLKSEEDHRRRRMRSLSGEFIRQGGLSDDWDTGKGESLLSHLSAVKDQRLSGYWCALLNRAHDHSIIRVPTWPNVAKGKPASQSSVSEWSRHKTIGEDAAGAVSGFPNGSYSFHTDRQPGAWWEVNLGERHRIHEIRIFNRVEHPKAADRLKFFELAGYADGNEPTFVHKDDGSRVWGGVEGNPFIFRSESGMVLSRLRVTVHGTEYLHLDQVEAYGYPV